MQKMIEFIEKQEVILRSITLSYSAIKVTNSQFLSNFPCLPHKVRVGEKMLFLLNSLGLISLYTKFHFLKMLSTLQYRRNYSSGPHSRKTYCYAVKKYRCLVVHVDTVLDLDTRAQNSCCLGWEVFIRLMRRKKHTPEKQNSWHGCKCCQFYVFRFTTTSSFSSVLRVYLKMHLDMLLTCEIYICKTSFSFSLCVKLCVTCFYNND